MFHSLKDLLPEALRRGRFSRQAEAMSAVEAFNEIVQQLLPPGRLSDVQAISFKNKILNVVCKNSSAAHWVSLHELDLLSALARKIPEIQVTKIYQRISSDDSLSL